MTYYSTPPRSDELWHHGIKGMRWGVRKYQNEDGSLTPAGERRYQNVDKAYHDVAKAIYKKEKKIRKRLKKQGTYYDDEYINENFGKHSNKQQQQRNEYYKTDIFKKRMQLSDKLERLESKQETLWDLDAPQKEKDAIYNKIVSTRKQLNDSYKGTHDSNAYAKQSMTKAKLMDLGFNEKTADALEKKTRKSKKAFRMYYL